MTEPTDFELLELATPYALHAVSDEERADIDRQIAGAPPSVAAAFTEEVRAVRETMAVVSASTITEPPAHLRAAVLAITASNQPNHQRRWRTTVLV
ncbi:anti-sigma-K factor RskA, partial [Mycobacterium montefiorense]